MYVADGFLSDKIGSSYGLFYPSLETYLDLSCEFDAPSCLTMARRLSQDALQSVSRASSFRFNSSQSICSRITVLDPSQIFFLIFTSLLYFYECIHGTTMPFFILLSFKSKQNSIAMTLEQNMLK